MPGRSAPWTRHRMVESLVTNPVWLLANGRTKPGGRSDRGPGCAQTGDHRTFGCPDSLSSSSRRLPRAGSAVHEVVSGGGGRDIPIPFLALERLSRTVFGLPGAEGVRPSTHRLRVAFRFSVVSLPSPWPSPPVSLTPSP